MLNQSIVHRLMNLVIEILLYIKVCIYVYSMTVLVHMCSAVKELDKAISRKRRELREFYD